MHWTERVEHANKLARDGDLAGADQAFRDAMDHDPGEQWIHYHYARRAFTSKEWEAAGERVEAYLARFDLRPPIASVAAQTFARLGQDAKAETLLRDAAATFGCTVELLEAKARIAELGWHWDQAIAYWEAYVEAMRGAKPRFPSSFPTIRFNHFTPMFGYFTGDRAPIVPNVWFWRHLVGDNYRLLSDDDVRGIIRLRRPAFLSTYDAIRIPACRADVARLVYLEAHGGLYVDMHCTLGAIDLFAQLPDTLERSEACFFTYLNPGPSLGNSIIMARKDAEVITQALDAIVANLERHRAAEAAAEGHVPYNIFTLSGPAAIRQVLCEPETLDVAAHYRGRVENRSIQIKRADAPIVPFSVYSYRRKGQHWSERQKVEPLFAR